MTRAIKRCFDLFAASVLLVGLLPLYGLIAVAVRLSMGSPVLFRQQRPGFCEKPFMLLKFRSMRNAYDRDGNPLPDKDRLTRLGRVLRSTSLDELPSLINVLKGDLSFVGPRPLLTRYLPFMTARERIRHTMRPGITGLAQVKGRNTVSWDKRLAYDVRYVEAWTLSLDLTILLLTLVAVVKRDGVVVDPTSQMRDLDVERKSRYQDESHHHAPSRQAA